MQNSPISEIHPLDLQSLKRFANSDAMNIILRGFQMQPSNVKDFDDYNREIGFHYPRIIDETMISGFKLDKSLIVKVFFLDLDKRLELLRQSQKNLQQSEFYPDYYAITIVQCFSALLIADLNSVGFDIIYEFLDGLSSAWHCLPQHPQCGEIFMHFYSNFLVQCPQNVIFDHISDIDKFGVDFSQFLPQYTPILLDSVNLLLLFIIDSDNPDKTKRNLDSKASILFNHFCFVQQSIFWKLARKSPHFADLQNKIMELIPYITINHIQLISPLFSFIFHYLQPSSENDNILDDSNEAQSQSPPHSFHQIDSNLTKNEIETQIIPLIADLFDRLINENSQDCNLFPETNCQSKQSDVIVQESQLKSFQIPSSAPLPIDFKTHYHFDSNNFVDVFNNRASIIKQIVDIFIGLNHQYSLQRPIHEFLLSICHPKIQSGDLKYQAIIQLYLHYESINLDGLYKVMILNKLLDSMLSNLFKTSLSLFDFKQSETPDIRILMRFNLFDMIYKIYAKLQTKTIIQSVAIFWTFKLFHPRMFTEIAFLINHSKILELITDHDLKVNIITIIATEISAQQQIHALGNQFVGVYMHIFVLVIGSFAKIESFHQMLCQNHLFVESVMSLIFEPEIYDDVYALITSISPLKAESQYIKLSLQNIIGSLNSQFKLFSNREDFSNLSETDKSTLLQTMRIFINFISVLQFFIKNGTCTFISFFVENHFFAELCNLVSLFPPINSKASDQELVVPFENLIIAIIGLFKVFDCPPIISAKSIPFKLLIQPIRTFTITPRIYESLKLLVSYSDHFKSIDNSGALHLLVFSTEGSDYFPPLLEEISTLCRDSFFNCFTVFDSGILFSLLEKIDQKGNMVYTSSDNKKYDLVLIILSLFCCVNICVSSRQLVYAFLRLFHIFEEAPSMADNSLTPAFTKTVPTNIESYLNFFRNMITFGRSITKLPSSFIHLASNKESIEMKSPPLKDLNQGFTISIWMLLDSFAESDAFSITLFKGKNTFLHFYFLKTKLCLEFYSTSLSIKLDTKIKFPKLERFNLTMNYDKDIGLTVYINEERSGFIDKPLDFLTEEFETLTFHPHPTSQLKWSYHGQLSLFALFIGRYNSENSQQLAKQINQYGENNPSAVSSMPNVYYVFSPFKSRDTILFNHKEEIPSIATCTGSVYTFVACFCQLFESSNGGAFLTSFWSLIGLPYPDGTVEKKLVSWFTQLFETVCQQSSVIEEQLITSNACQIISYFLQSLPNNSISSDLWSCFSRLHRNVKNPNLKKDICHHVLFNFAIWIKAPLVSADLVYLFKEWRSFFQNNSYEDWSDLTIKYMLDILDYYMIIHMNGENMEEVINEICISMGKISYWSFSQDEADSTLKFCQTIGEQSIVLSLLKLFDAHFTESNCKSNRKPNLFLDCLFKRIPLIFLKGNVDTKNEIILLFTKIFEKEKDFSVLIGFVYSIVYHEKSRTDNALYLMNHFMAASINCNLNDFDKAHAFTITSTPFFLISLFAASFVSDNVRATRFLPFLGKVSAIPYNQSKISNDFNDYMILILVFYGIVVDTSSLPFISAFLFRKIDHLSFAFLIINALEQYIHTDFTSRLGDLIIHCSSFLVSDSTIPNKDKYRYFELFLAKLFYHLQMVDDEKSTEKPEKEENAASFKLRNQSSSSKYEYPNKITFWSFLQQAKNLLNNQIPVSTYSFGCLLQNEHLIEFKVVKSILQLLAILLQDPTIIVDPNLISAFVFYLTLQTTDIDSLLPLLSQIIPKIHLTEPLQFNMSQRKKKDQPTKFLKDYFNQNYIEPSIFLFQRTTDILKKCSDILHDFIHQSISSIEVIQPFSSLSTIVTKCSNSQISADSSSSLPLSSQPSQNITKSDRDFNEKFVVNFISKFFHFLAVQMIIPDESIQTRNSIWRLNAAFSNSDQAWKKLVHKLRNERSLFVSALIKRTGRHYKRTSYYDYRFRPMLMVPNNRFDIHLKASELAMKLSSSPDPTDFESQGDIFAKSLKFNEYHNEEFHSDGSTEKLLSSSACEKINLTGRKRGTFEVFSKGYRFTYGNKRIVLKAESVLYIYWRWDLLIPNSIEIFMNDHRSYFFSFTDEKNHSFVKDKLLKIQLPNTLFIQLNEPQIELRNSQLTEKWLNYSISTFDYIMNLNMLSGRSFLNPSCYPVFPWVLVEYSSPHLSIENKTIYRDFKTPIGAINPQLLNQRKEKLQNELEAIQAEYESGSIDIEQYNEISKRSSFLYQTGFSNPFIVTYYMLRLEPFTTLHISLNDGKFDNPNRLFMSIYESFMMLVTTSATFRELIPEFFFQSEFLVNSDKFNFGETIKKGVVNHVELPTWSKTPHDFVHKHLKALESDVCSAEISNWIDLIFGFKQTGQNAIDNDNTFDPHMYKNNSVDETDPRTSHIREWVGQIPIQLFDKEHPKRVIRRITQPSMSNQTYLTAIPISVTDSSSCLVTALNYKGDSPDNLEIYSVHKNGDIYLTRFKNGPVLPLYSNKLLPTNPRLIATFGNSSFAFSLNDGSGILATQASKFRSEKVETSEGNPHIGPINCISMFSNSILTGGCDTSIVLWKCNKSRISVIAQSVVNNDTITAVAVNNNYGIAISCSRDGIMMIFRIPHLYFIRSINLHQDYLQNDTNTKTSFVADTVMVTKGMGNIIVVLKNENLDGAMKSEKSTKIRNYTINGQWIKDIEFNQNKTADGLEGDLIDVIPITSRTMEDYLLILVKHQTDQKLYLIEVQTMDVLAPIPIDQKSLQSNITKFSYHEEAGLMIFAYDNLELCVIPFNLDIFLDELKQKNKKTIKCVNATD